MSPFRGRGEMREDCLKMDLWIQSKEDGIGLHSIAHWVLIQQLCPTDTFARLCLAVGLVCRLWPGRARPCPPIRCRCRRNLFLRQSSQNCWIACVLLVGCAITVCAPRKPTPTGSCVSSASTTSGTGWRWVQPRSTLSSPTWLSRGRSAPRLRIRPSALFLLLYRTVLEVDPGQIGGVIRAQRPKRLPVVLTREEIDLVLAELTDSYRLIVQLLYGSGLRLLEALRLRIQDLDFARHEILVRHGKGGKDRRTMLPLVLSLPCGLTWRVCAAAPKGTGAGRGQVRLPEAFERKVPSASTDGRWQWVFPSSTISVDPRTGWRGRHHLHQGTVSREISQAGRRARPRTVSAIRLPPTCSRRVMTFAPCRSCWGMRASRRL